MKVLVFGATGGTGRAVILALQSRGHAVTAFARHPGRLKDIPDLMVVQGDAMAADDVAAAVAGQEAVVVSLGNTQGSIGLKLGAKRTTAANVCEVGTRNIVAAMRSAGVSRLVCVTAYGVGDTRDRLPLLYRMFYRFVLREQIADKEEQEKVVKASGLDWTLVQPVGLNDKPAAGRYLASLAGETRTHMVSRADLAAYIAGEVTGRAHLYQTVSFSGQPA
jgi:uncharacterized protein YbjT (DUF2867 family)